MRVLHVAEILPGGVSSYLSDLLPHQVDSLGAGQIAILGPHNQLDHIPEIVGLERFGFARSRRSLRSTAALFQRLRKVSRTFNPDIVHLHSSFAGLVGRLPGAFAGSPRPGIVYTAHGWAIDPSRPSKHHSLLVGVEKALASRCDVIINISEHESAFLGPFGFPREKLRYVLTGLGAGHAQHGVDPHGVTDGPIRLLFAGRLDFQKAFDLLYPELLALPAGSIICRVAGSRTGDDERVYPSLANVTMLGWLSRTEVLRELMECDALIMPSRWEGMPISALEAMRAAKPVFASNRGPFPALLEDGIDGVLMDIDKPGFLAKALQGQTRETLARMGKAARARFEDRHRSETMAGKIEQIYRQLR